MSHPVYINSLSLRDDEYPAPLNLRKSLIGTIRKLNNTSSANINSAPRLSPCPTTTPRITTSPTAASTSTSSPTATRFMSPILTSGPSPPTRRPDRPGMNAFTVPSNEPPPAYTASPTAASGPTLPPAAPAYELQSPSSPSPPPAADAPAPPTTGTRGEDPYAFLTTFDTTLLIDDSGSMAGRGRREVSQALATIAPIVTQHDQDGIDIYFLNHSSGNPGAPSDGVAPGGYRGIKKASTVTRIFERVQPQGGTPTGVRVHNILKPYMAKLESELSQGRDFKPLNLIVLTDGVPSDDVESVLLAVAKKLDKLDAPPYQVGVQFFQVGNEPGAREALEELDDGLSELVEGGVRDIVDTVTWASTEGSISLTGELILKCLLGAVNRRLDRRGR